MSSRCSRTDPSTSSTRYAEAFGRDVTASASSVPSNRSPTKSSAASPAGKPSPTSRWNAGRRVSFEYGEEIAAVPGPHLDRFDDEAVSRFFGSAFTVAAQSDRQGLRLEGAAIAPREGEILSCGVVSGAVQVPRGGLPIVLLADHGTTGGYPVIATVSAADLGCVAQRAAGESLRFQRVDREVFFRERGLKQFIEAGAVLGMGTDSGTPMNFHTEALWREIKAHVDMGMPPLRALAAATRVNARIIGRGADLGTLEAGKLADVIVVKGDPLFSVTALAQVELVVKDGAIVKR